MAYSSGSRRGGSPRGGARGGYGRGGSRGGGRPGTRGGGRRAGPPRGGGTNATAMGVAIVLIIGVIAVIIVASGGKKKPKPVDTYEELTGDSHVERGPEAPPEPERPPPPDISPEIVQVAKEIVAWMADEEAKATAAHEAAMDAKRRGDDETWQAKLREAREHLLNIRERWNEEVEGPIDGELPSGCPYDAAEVANYHIGKEAGKITKALKFLSAITKQLRR